jgi:hypothetical protein
MDEQSTVALRYMSDDGQSVDARSADYIDGQLKHLRYLERHLAEFAREPGLGHVQRLALHSACVVIEALRERDERRRSFARAREKEAVREERRAAEKAILDVADAHLADSPEGADVRLAAWCEFLKADGLDSWLSDRYLSCFAEWQATKNALSSWKLRMVLGDILRGRRSEEFRMAFHAWLNAKNAKVLLTRAAKALREGQPNDMGRI